MATKYNYEITLSRELFESLADLAGVVDPTLEMSRDDIAEEGAEEVTMTMRYRFKPELITNIGHLKPFAKGLRSVLEAETITDRVRAGADLLILVIEEKEAFEGLVSCVVFEQKTTGLQIQLDQVLDFGELLAQTEPEKAAA